MYAVIFLISLSLYPIDVSDLIQKSSKEYDRERRLIKNYKVFQEITSEIKSPTGSTQEKRKQIGYFVAPDKFFFFTKEKFINTQPIFVSQNEVERTTKKEIDWLSIEGVKKYQFSLLEEGQNYFHLYVLPREKFTDAMKGEIWIHKDTGKISRILKEPVNPKPGFESYKTEVFLPRNYL
jgi:hypothetical protein